MFGVILFTQVIEGLRSFEPRRLSRIGAAVEWAKVSRLGGQPLRIVDLVCGLVSAFR